MRCPFCEHELRAELHAGIEIDRCAHCAALWFDRDELGKYLAARGRAPSGHANVVPKESDTTLGCPRCRSQTLRACEAAGAVAQHCSSCSGLALGAASVAQLGRLSRGRGGGGGNWGDAARTAADAASAVADVGMVVDGAAGAMDGVMEGLLALIAGVFEGL